MNEELVVLRQIEEFSKQLKLSQAADFLFRGRYKHADALYVELISSYGDDPVILNLYATSLAQQGSFTQAESVWKKALNIQPGNNHFLDAINRINDLRKKGFRVFSNPFAWLKYALVIIVLLFFVIAVLMLSNLSQKMDRFTAFENRMLNQNAASTNPANTKANSKLEKVARNLNAIPGIAAVPNESNIDIKFSEGLFYKGAVIKDNSKTTLSDIAKNLDSFDGTIYILGCTDDLPVTLNEIFSDNTSLALERAEAVYNFIKVSANIPLNKIYLGKLPIEQSPFPNTSIKEKLKNRTVVIKLSGNSVEVMHY